MRQLSRDGKIVTWFGVKFPHKTVGEAQILENLVARTFREGQEDVRRSIRDILNVEERE